MNRRPRRTKVFLSFIKYISSEKWTECFEVHHPFELGPSSKKTKVALVLAVSSMFLISRMRTRTNIMCSLDSRNWTILPMLSFNINSNQYNSRYKCTQNCCQKTSLLFITFLFITKHCQTYVKHIVLFLRFVYDNL